MKIVFSVLFCFVNIYFPANFSHNFLDSKIKQESEGKSFRLFSQGGLGDLLRMEYASTADKSDALIDLFSPMSEEERERLFSSLNEKVRDIRLIERIVKEQNGNTKLDPSWAPRVSIVGETAGVFSCDELGGDSHCFYSINVHVLRSSEQSFGRELLVNFKLELVGSDINLSRNAERGISFEWQLLARTLVDKRDIRER